MSEREKRKRMIELAFVLEAWETLLARRTLTASPN